MNEYLLLTAILAPLFAAILVAITPSLSKRVAKTFAIFATGYSMLVAITLFLDLFSLGNTSSYNFLCSFTSLPIPEFALNGISSVMFLLASIVSFTAVLTGKTAFTKNYKTYIILLLVSVMGLLAMFASINMIWAYIFHEFALVPTFIATVYWGSAGKRSAAMQMAIYLTLGALISLTGIIALATYVEAPSYNIVDLMQSIKLTFNGQSSMADASFIMMLIGFSILVSVFPFHSWAFKGYTAAPTAFSMIHAGVLKKFGFYMLVQLALPALPLAAEKYLPYLAIFALFNLVLIGIYTMAQRDLKMMLSYSSVSHIAICMLGLSTMSVLGVGSAILYAFAHGLSIALLFHLSNIVVNKTETYDMKEMGGLITRTPVLCGFFLVGIMASIALPGFANFWGEVGVFVALFKYNPIYLAIVALGLIISAIYGLRAVANVFFGESKAKYESLTDINLKEKIPAIILIVFLVIVGFYPKVITKVVDENLTTSINLYQNNK